MKATYILGLVSTFFLLSCGTQRQRTLTSEKAPETQENLIPAPLPNPGPVVPPADPCNIEGTVVAVGARVTQNLEAEFQLTMTKSGNCGQGRFNIAGTPDFFDSFTVLKNTYTTVGSVQDARNVKFVEVGTGKILHTENVSFTVVVETGPPSTKATCEIHKLGPIPRTNAPASVVVSVNGMPQGATGQVLTLNGAPIPPGSPQLIQSIAPNSGLYTGIAQVLYVLNGQTETSLCRTDIAAPICEQSAQFNLSSFKVDSSTTLHGAIQRVFVNGIEATPLLTASSNVLNIQLAANASSGTVSAVAVDSSGNVGDCSAPWSRPEITASRVGYAKFKYVTNAFSAILANNLIASGYGHYDDSITSSGWRRAYQTQSNFRVTTDQTASYVGRCPSGSVVTGFDKGAGNTHFSTIQCTTLRPGITITGIHPVSGPWGTNRYVECPNGEVLLGISESSGQLTDICGLLQWVN